jgi:DNA polymerase/3'-5' exonuclease PolX
LTEETVFEAASTNDQQSVATTQEQQTYLTALVGETQKYKTPEELAKAYANADAHILELKEKLRLAEEKAQEAKTIDDVLERIASKQEVSTEATSSDAPGMTPEALETLVEKTLTKRQQDDVRKTNLLAADKALKERFGEKATEVFKAQADTPEKAKVLMDLAAVDPNKFVSLFASLSVSNAMDTGSSVTTSVSSMARGNRENTEGTKEWATKVRRENPSLYWSSNFQAKFQSMVTKNPSLYFGN